MVNRGFDALLWYRGYGARYDWRVVKVQHVVCSGIRGKGTFTLEVLHEATVRQRKACKEAMVKKSGQKRSVLSHTV